MKGVEVFKPNIKGIKTFSYEPYQSAEEFLSEMDRHGNAITCDGEEWLIPGTVRNTMITVATIDGIIKLTYKQMLEMGFKFRDGKICGKLS